MVAPDVIHLRSLAADFRSRAETAEPETARMLTELAEDFEAEARKLEAGSIDPPGRRPVSEGSSRHW